jgi:hypothetical protein
MTIRHGPSGERPREKLIEHGAHALPDAENGIGGSLRHPQRRTSRPQRAEAV